MSERAPAFPGLAVDDNRARKQAEVTLSELCLSDPLPQHVSNISHAAYASLEGIDFVVTRDGRPLRAQFQEVADRYGVKTVRLGEPVRVLEAVNHSSRYGPAALQSTPMQTIEVTDTPVAVAKRHQSFAGGEPKTVFYAAWSHSFLIYTGGRCPRN